MTPAEKTITGYTKAIAYFLGFISFALLVTILIMFSEILIPFTLAIFLTFLFHPLVIYLEKRKVPKWFSILLIFIFISALYYLFGMLIVSSLSTFPAKLEKYIPNITSTVQAILAPFNLTLTEAARLFEINIATLSAENILGELFQAGIIQDVLNSITNMLGNFFIVLIFWIFMVMGKTKFEDRLRVAFAKNKEMVDKNINTIDTQLQSYIIIKTILSLITGVVTTIILLIYQIDFAIVWGLLAFLLNYIPNIGSLIATIAPIIIGLLEYGLGLTTISMSILLLLNQNIIGNLVEPHYLGRTMDLSPVFVLLMLIFWGWVWGIVGMFLAVPIAASFKILCSNIEPLKPIAIIMGSKVHQADLFSTKEFKKSKPD